MPRGRIPREPQRVRGGAEQTPSEARSGTKLHRAPRRQAISVPSSRTTSPRTARTAKATIAAAEERRRVSRENTPRRRRTRDSTPSPRRGPGSTAAPGSGPAPVEVASTAGTETRPIAAGIARARTTGCRSSGTAPRADSRRTRIITRGSRATGRLWRVRARVRARASGSAGVVLRGSVADAGILPGRHPGVLSAEGGNEGVARDAARGRGENAVARGVASIEGEASANEWKKMIRAAPCCHVDGLAITLRHNEGRVARASRFGRVAPSPWFRGTFARRIQGRSTSFRRRTSRRRRGRWRPSRPRSSPLGR